MKESMFRNIIRMLFFMALFFAAPVVSADTNMEEAVRQYGGQTTDVFILPSGLRLIDAEAFEGSGVTVIELPEGIEEVGSRAFADTRRQIAVYIIRQTPFFIAEDAFDTANSVFFCFADSFAEDWARTHGLLFFRFYAFITIQQSAVHAFLKRCITICGLQAISTCCRMMNNWLTVIGNIWNPRGNPEMHVLALDFP